MAYGSIANNMYPTLSEREVVAQMQAENAKLREYIEAMRQCAGEIKRDVGCNECPMYRENETQWCVRKLVGCELGIEANDE